MNAPSARCTAAARTPVPLELAASRREDGAGVWKGEKEGGGRRRDEEAGGKRREEGGGIFRIFRHEIVIQEVCCSGLGKQVAR